MKVELNLGVGEFKELVFGSGHHGRLHGPLSGQPCRRPGCRGVLVLRRRDCDGRPFYRCSNHEYGTCKHTEPYTDIPLTKCVVANNLSMLPDAPPMMPTPPVTPGGCGFAVVDWMCRVMRCRPEQAAGRISSIKSHTLHACARYFSMPPQQVWDCLSARSVRKTA